MFWREESISFSKITLHLGVVWEGYGYNLMKDLFVDEFDFDRKKS